jgi:group I intron endonuclease
MITTGIYKIQSLIHTDRCYVGSSVDIKNRWIIHLSKLKNNKHDSPILQAHYNKYGKNDLHFSIIESFDFISKEHLLSREQHYLDTSTHYFNCLSTAGSPLGTKRSDETKEKMRGRKCSDEAKEKMRKAKLGKTSPMLGKHHSEETLFKLRNSHLGQVSNMKGKHHSEETLEKMRKRMKGRPSPMLGKHHSEEVKEKMKNRNYSEEVKQNMSQGRKKLFAEGYIHPMKGKHWSEETRFKMLGKPSTFKNKHHTDESKHKQSQSRIYYLLEKELTNYINTYQ